MTASIPDDILVERILKGEASAFRLLVERYQNLVFTIAYRITANREEAEEVAQDVFIKVYHNLSSFKGDSKFSSWLYRISHNTALTKIRNSKPAAQTWHYNHDGEVQNEADRIFTREDLEKTIGLLEPEEATIITLFYLAELSLDEIAKTLNIETNAAKVRLYRTRKKLKKNWKY